MIQTIDWFHFATLSIPEFVDKIDPLEIVDRQFSSRNWRWTRVVWVFNTSLFFLISKIFILNLPDAFWDLLSI